MARREDYLLSRLLLTDGTVTFEQLSKVLMQWGEDSPLSLLQIVQDEKLISEEEGRWLMTSISKLCEQEESSSLASLDSILCQLIIKQNLISAETVNEYQRRISERGLRSSVSEALLRDGLIQPETFSNLRRISERIFYRRKIWALVRGKERLAGIFYSPGRDYDITQVQEASTMTSKDLTGLQKLVHDTKGLVATQNFTKPARRRGKELPPIFGHYEIIEEIASGGMGTVYKARHEDSEGIVALKVLHDEESSVEKVQRFKREAEATKKLKHPNIVGIYDIGVVDGRHYFTMDYIDGVPLNVLIKEAKIELEDCLNIIQGIARALHYAHG
ncbi:MAG TPA: protein kinase, partial [Planctomycetota bacterium]|nr:protein kinase [Planctomycetota bacterium]